MKNIIDARHENKSFKSLVDPAKSRRRESLDEI